MNAPLLQARGLSFAHPGGPALFDALDLEIRPREIVVLLGASGCGKSSLLRVLAGLSPARAGEVRFGGEPIDRPHPASAMLFQQSSLLPWLRVQDNVAFGLDFSRQPRIAVQERGRRVADALSAVGLASAARAWPAQLSGGMAQRVALARALARQPQLLFADEPFSALDAVTRSEMQQLLVDVVHRWRTAVLLVTHDLDEALAVGDRVLLMGRGGIRAGWAVPPDREAASAGIRALHAEIHDALVAARAPRAVAEHL
jgi:NitT/TauT family transport system ATP-binding protein